MKFRLLIFVLFQLNFCFAMTTHFTSIEVNGKNPSQIFSFFKNLDKSKYIQWHPTEHKDFRIIKLTDNFLGSKFYYDEVIDKFRIDFKWKVVKVIDNELVVMKAAHIIPIYLTLSLKETEFGTLIGHDLKIGYDFKITGITDFVVQNFIFTPKRMKSLSRHAQEEFKNLEKII